MDMEKARKVVALEARAKAAAEELGKVSSELNRLGMEIKLSGWDWNQQGSYADICPQGSVQINVVDRDTR